MRLIDVDAVIAEYDQIHEGEAGKARKLMEDAPTVEAIPIEWIENYLRNYRYMAPIEKCFVREMIKAWAERKAE